MSIDPTTKEAVRQRLKAGQGVSAIAREFGIGRETVRRFSLRPFGNATRCAGCGGLLAKLPCLLCKIRGAEGM